MAELSDEKVRAIRDHLFAVAELLRDVPAPGDGDKRVPLRVFWSAVEKQSGTFTQYTVSETLRAGGIEMAPAAVSARLNSMSKSGLLERPAKGHYRHKAKANGNGHG